jgi:hypothetical protein
VNDQHQTAATAGGGEHAARNQITNAMLAYATNTWNPGDPTPITMPTKVVDRRHNLHHHTGGGVYRLVVEVTGSLPEEAERRKPWNRLLTEDGPLYEA